MTSPLPGSRVVHTNHARSYGIGTVEAASPSIAVVRFDADRSPRTVLLADLANEHGIPLVLRSPYRVVYPCDVSIEISTQGDVAHGRATAP